MIAVALVIAPVVCIAAICDFAQKHDCCPKSEALANCPLKVLTSAKSQPLPVGEIPINEIAIQPAGDRENVTAPGFSILTRDLNIQNCVLRI